MRPSGEGDLAAIEAGFSPDVMICDMNMPGLGGSGTLLGLRALLPGALSFFPLEGRFESL